MQILHQISKGRWSVKSKYLMIRTMTARARAMARIAYFNSISILPQVIEKCWMDLAEMWLFALDMVPILGSILHATRTKDRTFAFSALSVELRLTTTARLQRSIALSWTSMFSSRLTQSWTSTRPNTNTWFEWWVNQECGSKTWSLHGQKISRLSREKKASLCRLQMLEQLSRLLV